MISQNNTMSIREAKDRVEKCFMYDGTLSKIEMIKLVRTVYVEGYKVGQFDAAHLGEPTQLDRIEAMLKAALGEMGN